MREPSHREDQHERPAHRQLGTALERPVKQWQRPLRHPECQQRDPDRDGYEREQDQCIVNRALGRQEEVGSSTGPSSPTEPTARR